MSLVDFSTAAHLGGSAILALFFVLLARQDPRPYLRDWTLAWIAQVLALAADVLPGPAAPALRGAVSAFLAALHGLLLCSAAHRYAHGRAAGAGYRLVVLPIAAACAAAAYGLPDDGPLRAGVHFVLASSYGAAAALLWRLRATSAMGLRLVTTVLLLFALVFTFLGAAFGFALPAGAAADLRGAAPVLVLCLQLLLSLGMVLAFMETSQQRLAAANARLEEAQEQLKAQAETDPLTGCANRRMFRELVDIVRADPDSHGVVILLDMDGLKKLNDSEGHAAGDQAIRRTAEALRAHTRATDSLVRWGGDEFVLILPGAGEGDARRKVREIDASLAAAGLRASAGVSAYGPEHDIVAALRAADKAMYRIKAERRS